MTLSNEALAAMIADANQAPSVHNTQPTRWRLLSDGRILVLEDHARRLPVGDPAGRDAAVSHGASIEGFALACAARGYSVFSEPIHDQERQSLRPVAQLTLSEGAATDELYRFVPSRRTHRGAFAGHTGRDALCSVKSANDVCLVEGAEGIGRLAQLNDEASFRTFQRAAYREELLSWMRLSPQHPLWGIDGLNAEALAMSRIEAIGAGIVLSPGIFEALDRLGAARAVVAERNVVKSAQAIILFHRPQAESPLTTGRRFYRLWLEIERTGLSAAPMAVLADDEETRKIIGREFKLKSGDRLITAFRVGIAPQKAFSPKPRLPGSALLV